MIKSWMVIGAVALLVVALGGALVTPDGSRWFNRLQRPRWLTFEPAIPFIWTVIYICAAWSAYVVWESALGSRKTWLMLLYLLLEVITTAYTPVLFRLRSLKVGTIIGGTGAVLSIILALLVLPISTWASLLLVPYMIWSPIGTYTTWEMMQLNPDAV
jgi:tryptophan-rich sensory protein